MSPADGPEVGRYGVRMGRPYGYLLSELGPDKGRLGRFYEDRLVAGRDGPVDGDRGE
jgi:hypothetical protein